jgi:GMP synthase (glutamine-hydrolysing)
VRPLRALVVQHVEAEPCGRIGEALVARGVSIDVVGTHLHHPVPHAIGEHRALVVMGGPMGVYEADRHPHLRDELLLIQDAVRRGVPVLGVCLGSQLVAHALGATVIPSGGREIGWLDVTTTTAAAKDDRLFGHAPASFRPWHWHGDVFTLPPGAVSLASSARTAHQAFRHGNAWGILFHLEVDLAIVAEMIERFGDDAREHGIDVAELARSAEASLDVLAPVATRMFGAFADLVVSEGSPSSQSR